MVHILTSVTFEYSYILTNVVNQTIKCLKFDSNQLLWTCLCREVDSIIVKGQFSSAVATNVHDRALHS